MYQYEGKHLEVGDNSHDFEYDIRTVIQYNGKYIVLLGIPFDCDAINNIYCIDDQAKVVWQSEDLSTLYPQLMNLSYEQMGIKDSSIYATDFYGRCYEINIDNGKIEGCRFVK